MPLPDVLAAVDLGSNSFHLLVARAVDGQVYPLDSLREPVRIGAGLTADKRIDRPAQARALEVLGRFGERLRGLPRNAVRAVGTNTLRVAKNATQFLRDGREALGFPIDIIAGREEARLIYLGVSHALPPLEGRRLVVDVGGGSTECIVGTGFESELTESLYMGCVSWSLQFFPDGRIDKARMKAAELAARQEFAAMARAYRGAGWQEAVGSSGTARALERIMIESGHTPEGITRDGLDRLRALLVREERAEPDRVPGLRSKSRAAVLPGGLAILIAAFDELGIEHMRVSDAALRHGLLYDLIGRTRHHDMREGTVAQFMRRYHVEVSHAERVAALACAIYDALAASRGEAKDDDPERQILGWAARLAEVGLSIAHAEYHKHSAYVLSNADMPGFSRMEQARLARIVLAHRGKLAKLAGAGLEPGDWALVFALRLAALVLRSRVEMRLPLMRVADDEAGFALELPQSWLDDNPLTAAALEDEAARWKAVGMGLSVSPLSERRAAQIARAG